VLSWIVKQTPGGTNKFIKSIDLVNLPNKENPELKLKEKLNVRDLFVSNFVEEFYDSFPYYYYNGSLTSP